MAHPLRVLFLDLNSFFASVEQQDRPELRNKPIAVVPMIADSTFVIAASAEAKAAGVKTVMRVSDAMLRCPNLTLVDATPAKYVHYHKLVIAAAEKVLPIEKVHSIDEFECHLLGKECAPQEAERLAMEIKQAIWSEVGSQMRCSIGIAPNSFLAKVGTELVKRDGLVILSDDKLPHALFGLKLTDLPGINRAMLARLQAHGIFTVEDLCRASASELKTAWGSIVGERWWHLLRGERLSLPETERKGMSNSHVLPPKMRTEQGAKQVMLRLLHKAASRLRAEGLVAGHISISVKGRTRSWDASLRIDSTSDTVHLTDIALKLWESSNFVNPNLVAVNFGDLEPAGMATPSLFTDRSTVAFSEALDKVNQKFGKQTVYLAGVQRAKWMASEKIAFQKTELFVEGSGDHEWGQKD